MSQTSEAYFIGRLIGSSGFQASTFCRWWITTTQNWTLMNGKNDGQTQVDAAADPGQPNIWSHPIDVQYEFEGTQGWPKITFEVWEQDSLGRSALGGYGFALLPMSPGKHDMSVTLWKPVGSRVQALTATYIGAPPHLQSRELVHSPTSRSQLTAETSGSVHMQIFVAIGHCPPTRVSL
jgi:B9 domain-containing protein 2